VIFLVFRLVGLTATSAREAAAGACGEGPEHMPSCRKTSGLRARCVKSVRKGADYRRGGPSRRVRRAESWSASYHLIIGVRGTRCLALSPGASRALAVGNAEQAASRSNAADQRTLNMHGRTGQPFAVRCACLAIWLRKSGQCKVFYRGLWQGFWGISYPPGNIQSNHPVAVAGPVRFVSGIIPGRRLFRSEREL